MSPPVPFVSGKGRTMSHFQIALYRRDVESVSTRRRARLLDRIRDLLRRRAATPDSEYCYFRVVHTRGSPCAKRTAA